MSRSEDARQILESEVFQEAVDNAREAFISRIIQNPVECIEATIGLKVLADILNEIEAISYDGKMSIYNEELNSKIQ